MPQFSTAQVHAGEARDAAHGARVTPIYLTAGFEFDSFAHAEGRFGGEEPGYTYSRSGNPTTAALERRVAALEGGRDAIAVGSGQAALTVALLALVQAGDHVLSAQSVYSGTRGLFENGLRRLGIDIEFVDDPTDLPAPKGRLVAGFDVGRTRDRSELAVFEEVDGRFVCRLLRSYVETPFAAQEADLAAV